MNFRIADTFTDSLTRLTADEQKAAKTSAFDLQMNPAHPGLQFHQLDKARDKNFWSLRVSRDIRMIVHRSNDSVLLCYVDHHDKAYDWAERRKLETHPKTGAAQLVEVREMVKEVVVPVFIPFRPASPRTMISSARRWRSKAAKRHFNHFAPFPSVQQSEMVGWMPFFDARGFTPRVLSFNFSRT